MSFHFYRTRPVLLPALLLVLLISTSPMIQAHAKHSSPSPKAVTTVTHDHDDDHDLITLSPAQQQRAGIEIRTVTLSTPPKSWNVPAIIRPHQNHTYALSLPMNAQVLQRHVSLGQSVRIGDPLFTLRSEELAFAQHEWLSRYDEWQRIQTIGKNNAGNDVYNRVRQQVWDAEARLRRFGITPSEVTTRTHFGEHVLLSPFAGTVIDDALSLGKHIPQGEILLTLSDLSQQLADVYLPSTQGVTQPQACQAQQLTQAGAYRTIRSQRHLPQYTDKGGQALLQVSFDSGDQPLLINSHASVLVECPSSTQLTALPEQALVMSAEGEWQVFIEVATGQYEATTVERDAIDVRNMQRQVLVAGLNEGQRVVIAGAFFIAAEAAKDGFDAHNH